MPVEDINDIKRLTGSLGSIFEDPYEISLETQEKSTTLLTSLLDEVGSVESVEDATSTLSNILDVSSKLLQSSAAMADVNDVNNTDVLAMKTKSSNETKVRNFSLTSNSLFPCS